MLAGTLTRAEGARRLKVRYAQFLAALDALRTPVLPPELCQLGLLALVNPARRPASSSACRIQCQTAGMVRSGSRDLGDRAVTFRQSPTTSAL